MCDKSHCGIFVLGGLPEHRVAWMVTGCCSSEYRDPNPNYILFEPKRAVTALQEKAVSGHLAPNLNNNSAAKSGHWASKPAIARKH